MHIGLEIRWIERETSGGVVHCLEGVLDRLIRRNPQHHFFVYGTVFSNSLVDLGHANATIEVLPLDNAWESLQACLTRDGIDVLFRAYPAPDTLRFPLARQIFFIPDLQHERFPEFFSEADLGHRREAFGRALGGAGAIGTLSDYARRTILDSPQTRCRDIFLMPPAVKSGTGGTVRPELEKRVDEIGPFFVFPANLWPHKNHRRLIQAFERASQRLSGSVAMVFTGFADDWPKIAAEFPGLPLHHLGFVSESELSLLYRRAVALTFFSLYEGFGMPLLEAFREGCPVVCANTCSLPEVGGAAVLACDPTDIDAMEDALVRIARDGDLRAALVAAGRERLSAYSWDGSADALMAAIERTAGWPQVSVGAAPPLVSIVTPSFQQGRFIKRTIDSVLAQTYPQIDYVVMDGGSRDETRAVLESYGDRLRWRSEPDRGQTHAINKGFAEAKGTIRAYLNSDDTLKPDAVERVVAFFGRHPACDMVYGDADYIDADDRVTGTYPTAEYSFERLMWDCCVCQPAAFWRDAIAKRVGPFDESLDYVMDYDYWLRIARAGGDIRHLPETLACSRLHPDTKTLSRRSDIYAEIFATCRKHGGYVSANYYEGLWHHRLREKRTLLSTVLRPYPDAYRRIAAWHRRLAGDAKAEAAARARVQRAKTTKGSPGPPAHAVSGFWNDGWLAAQARFALPRLKNATALHITGAAVADCDLSVRAAGRVLASLPLRAKEISRVALPTPDTLPLELTFSASSRDAFGRDVAFRLLSTNLFLERDLKL